MKLQSSLLLLLLTFGLAACSNDDDDDTNNTPSMAPVAEATLVVNGQTLTSDSVAIIAGGQGGMSLAVTAGGSNQFSAVVVPYIIESSHSTADGDIVSAFFLSPEGFYPVNDTDDGNVSITVTDHNTMTDRMSGSFEFEALNEPTNVVVSGTFTNAKVYPSFIQSHDIDVSIDGSEMIEDHSFTFEDANPNTILIRAIKDVHESVNIRMFRNTTVVGTMTTGDVFNGPGPSVQFVSDGVYYDSENGEGSYTITAFEPGVSGTNTGSITMDLNVTVDDGAGNSKVLAGTVTATF